MSRRKRIIFTAASVFCVGVVLVLYLLQSRWLRENIRHRMAAAVQSATGGQMELQSFRFNWHLLTAEMDGVVVHGTEARNDAPLFQADAVRVRLQIRSLLKRNADIASLQIEAPQLHLLLRPDGTTNLPAPRRVTPTQLVNQLFQLKLRQVSLRHGLLHVNDQRTPLDLIANDVGVGLLYDRNGPYYTLHLTLAEMDVHWAKTQEFQGSLHASAQLAQNQLTLKKAIFSSGNSKAELSGSLRDFAQPILRWNVQSQIDASQLAAALHVENLRSGILSLNGSGYRDAHTPFSFTGEVHGQRLSYLARTFLLKDVKLKSKLIIDGNILRFPDLDLTGPDLQWSGKAELMDYRKVSLRGDVARLDLRTVATAMGAKSFGWSAVVHGPINMDGLLRPRIGDFNVNGNLQLSPASGGSPVSGNIAFAYHQGNNLVELGNSKLNLPNTEVAISGVPGARLKMSVDSTDLNDLQLVLSLAHQPFTEIRLPVLLPNGTAHFDGSVSGSLHDPQVAGVLALTNFQMSGANWQSLRSSFDVGKSSLAFSSFEVQQNTMEGRAKGQVALTNWSVRLQSSLRLQGRFSGLNVERLLGTYLAKAGLRSTGGVAAGTFALTGTVSDPTGDLQVKIVNLDAYSEHLDSLAANIKLKDGQLQIINGRGKSGSASLSFTGGYQHEPSNWQKGTLSLDVDSNVFPLSDLASVRQRLPNLSARTETHSKTVLFISPSHVQLSRSDGSVSLSNVTVNHVEYGSFTLNTSTHGQTVEGNLEGNLLSSRVSGTAQLQLAPEMPVKAQLQFGQIDLNALAAIFLPAYPKSALAGFVRGGVTLGGPLWQWEKIRAAVKLDDLQITSPEIKRAGLINRQANLILHNSAPILIEAANGAAAVSSMELTGPDTKLSITGVVPFVQSRPMQLRVDGTVDLRIAGLFKANLQSSGESRISAVVGGTLAHPTVTGTLDLHNGRLFLNGLPNGLSDLNGAIEFDRDRATLQKVTAHSGGGNVAFGGFLTFSAGHPLVYRLDANSQDVRVRYASSVSVTSASQLTLTGTSQNSILAGTATVSRVIFNPNADVGALLASTAVAEPIGEEPDFLSGLQLDIHVDSAPNFQLSTSLSRDVQAAIDLQLRGNPKNPVLLGSIEADEGDIRVFGSRYSINRGQISFINPAKIEPVLDLDLRTQARGINVDITVSGTLNKLNINYRSDPPLQPRDIIALLTVGRAPSINPNTPNSRLASNNDIGALQSGANTVLGQAISPNASRLQKLFGITNIKIDPLVQGITNTSQARLTLEQQISRQITVTYVTNLSQTSEQIFRLEYALDPQFSLVALRDDNGEFGLDILYKKRFK